jgi:hypothetical protein
MSGAIGSTPLLQRLRELGWIEGSTIAIEIRWAEERTERYAEIAAELSLRDGSIVLLPAANLPHRPPYYYTMHCSLF